jgi:hypothetical protein
MLSMATSPWRAMPEITRALCVCLFRLSIEGESSNNKAYAPRSAEVVPAYPTPTELFGMTRNETRYACARARNDIVFNIKTPLSQRTSVQNVSKLGFAQRADEIVKRRVFGYAACIKQASCCSLHALRI